MGLRKLFVIQLRSLALSALLATSLVAQAGVVNLFSLSGNFDQKFFGSGSTPYFAQSVKADDVNWADLSFSVGQQGTGGTFNLLVTESVLDMTLPGTHFRPDANNVLFSTQLTHNGHGAQRFDITLDTSVASGATYFFVLQGKGQTLQGSSVLATQYYGTDKYAAGEFIYSASDAAFNGISKQWGSRFSAREDLVFRAEFNGGAVVAAAEADVPEPGSLALLGLGLAGLAVFRQRKTI